MAPLATEMIVHVFLLIFHGAEEYRVIWTLIYSVLILALLAANGYTNGYINSSISGLQMSSGSGSISSPIHMHTIVQRLFLL